MREKKQGEMFCVACNAYTSAILKEINGEVEQVEEKEKVEPPKTPSSSTPSLPPQITKSPLQKTPQRPNLSCHDEMEGRNSDRCTEYELFLWKEMDQMKEQISTCPLLESRIQMVRYLKECAECLQAIQNLQANQQKM